MAAGWDYKHPPRGSCSSGCPRRGRCHYQGCKAKPKVSKQNTARYGYVKGQPRVFCRRHAPLSPSVVSTQRGCWAARGVPVEKVRPLALWLIRRYGARPAAELAGMSFSGFSQVAYAKKKKRVTPHSEHLWWACSGSMSSPQRGQASSGSEFTTAVGAVLSRLRLWG